MLAGEADDDQPVNQKNHQDGDGEAERVQDDKVDQGDDSDQLDDQAEIDERLEAGDNGNYEQQGGDAESGRRHHGQVQLFG